MSNKLQNTRCTLRQTTNSSHCSSINSGIEQRPIESSFKRLSFSVENIKNPFVEILPLKFPKKRIIKGFNNHMLSESQQKVFRPAIRPSSTRFQQNKQRTWKKQKKKGQFYTFNQQSEENNICQLSLNQSLEYLHQSSLQKSSRYQFHHRIAQQYISNPIIHGGSDQSFKNKTVKKHYTQNGKQKNYGQACKATFDWKVDLSKGKQRFNNICNSKPKESILQTSCLFKKSRQNNYKIKPQNQRDRVQNGGYLSIYNSKKKAFK